MGSGLYPTLLDWRFPLLPNPLRRCATERKCRMNWLTFQLSRTRCLIAHLFCRPDLARLNVVEGELYRLRIRIAERTRALHAAEKHIMDLDAALSDSISQRLSDQCRKAGDSVSSASHYGWEGPYIRVKDPRERPQSICAALVGESKP